jgi:hypothetical protein
MNRWAWAGGAFLWILAGCGASGSSDVGGPLDVRYVVPDAQAKDVKADPGKDDTADSGDPGTVDTALPADPGGFDPGGLPDLVLDPGGWDPGGFEEPDMADEPETWDEEITETVEVVDDCNPRAKLVYVVTEENVLLQFHADTLTFKKVGTLDCNTGFLATPFSMAIDRNADAWVLYTSGFLYKVSTLDASCQNTTFQAGQNGFGTFGMGFASDLAMSAQETLYVSSYVESSFGQSMLGSISFPDLKLKSLAPLGSEVGSAELTGNGLGELWGFFPNASPPLVARIDKATGVILDKFPLPSGTVSNVQAWAFAFWGGWFYLFFQSFLDSSSNVYRLDTTNGEFKKLMSNVGYTITGAGVSSCAPTGPQ